MPRRLRQSRPPFVLLHGVHLRLKLDRQAPDVPRRRAWRHGGLQLVVLGRELHLAEQVLGHGGASGQPMDVPVLGLELLFYPLWVDAPRGFLEAPARVGFGDSWRARLESRGLPLFDF